MLRSILRWLTPPLHETNRPCERFVDLTFGDCQYSPDINAWSTPWQLAENRQIRVMGRSQRPTEEQVVLWHQFLERVPTLLREANDSITEPRVTSFTPDVIRREGVEISEVRFESDGTVHLFLDLMITDQHGYELYPQVIFKNWELVSSEWCV
jgi:hypothetical protein